MMAIQSNAPYINGWHVYMGSAERNLVLLQSDFDAPSREDWIALDSMLHGNEYEYNDMLSDDNQARIHPAHQHRFMIKYCVPTWMWSVPLLLLIGFVWMQYSNYIHGVFLREGLEQELIKHHDKRMFEQNLVELYPSIAPPPKYNEAIAIGILEAQPTVNSDGIVTKA